MGTFQSGWWAGSGHQNSSRLSRLFRGCEVLVGGCFGAAGGLFRRTSFSLSRRSLPPRWSSFTGLRWPSLGVDA